MTPLFKNIETIKDVDEYIKFDPFTIDGQAYEAGAIVKMDLIFKSDAAITYSLAGTLSGTSVQFKFEDTDNTIVGTYGFKIEVTYTNGDKFIPVEGNLNVRC